MGRPRHPVGLLPSPDHVYGRPEHRDVEDARQVIKSWKVHQESKEIKMPPDFKKINKFALTHKNAKIKVSNLTAIQARADFTCERPAN